MIYRIFPSKDTFITDAKKNNVPQTGSNMGSSEILHVYKKAGVSGSVGFTSSSSLARILTMFDFSEFSAFTASLGTQVSASFRLRFFDTQHDKEIPSSFDLIVQPLAQQWDEGRGRDVDTFSDKGFSNWMKSTSTTFWTTPGASGTGPVSQMHFDDGRENLDVDVTEAVALWLTGSLVNNGFLVKLSSSQEAGYQDYYIKMFHGRETFFKDKRPFVEARWDDSTKDDRSNFSFDRSGSLFLYNKMNGQLADIPSVGTGQIGVRVADKSGTLFFVTGSHTGRTGVYSASFFVPTGSYSGSLFNDFWFDLSSTASWFMTGSFPVAGSPSSPTLSWKPYHVNVVNLKDEYDLDESPLLRLFVRDQNYNPPRVLTASLGANGTVVAKAYYGVVNDRTGEVVVSFGTGSQEHTRLSYDGGGNYFRLHMGSFSSRNVYRITFLFDVDGQVQKIDQGFKFKVR